MNDIAIIWLNRHKFTLVDADNIGWLSVNKWSFNGNYAIRVVRIGGKQKNIMMHREINKTPSHLETDHINGFKLDNRKSNLRSVTQSQNNLNRVAHKSKNRTSKYKGVSLKRDTGKWLAQIQVNKKVTNLGHYVKERDAAKAYDLAAKEIFGEYARLNLS